MTHWDDLRRHQAGIRDRAILSLFDDPARASGFAAETDGMLLDYSKTNIDAKARDLLIALAKGAGVADRRAAMFSGAKINETEGRAVLHTALRNLDTPVIVDGRDVLPEVRATLARRADLPDELLERMAGDRHPAVREAVAGALRLSDEALSRLAFDREESVRLAVARNRNAPPTALEVLAANSSAQIRLLVAEHRRASEPVLLRLLNGSGDRAERIARERLPGGGKPAQ